MAHDRGTFDAQSLLLLIFIKSFSLSVSVFVPVLDVT